MKLITLIFLLLVAWLSGCSSTAPTTPEPVQVENILRSERLIIYFSPRCPHCTKAKNWMDVRAIDYEARDVNDPRFRSEHRALGGRGVPLFVLRGRILQGFEPEGLEAFLRRGGYRKE